MELPKDTPQIFEWLSKGQFLNSHSTNEDQERYYRVLEEHIEAYRNYFQQIGFELEGGKNYFYLSRKESKSSLEDKLQKLSRYINILEFCLDVDPLFGRGSRLKLEVWSAKISEDILLKRKLKKLEARGENEYEKLRRILDLMCKDGFLEIENEQEKIYRVLAAIQYLQNLIDQIKPEEYHP